MKLVRQDIRRSPPPRAEICCRRGLQQTRHHRFHSGAATCFLRPPVPFKRTRLSCLAQSATAAANSRCAEQPKLLLSQWLAWQTVRRVSLAAVCCAACLSLASSMQTSAPFAAASLTFRSAAQTGLRGAARSAAAGFGAGVLHTLAGADHLAALTPLTFGHGHVKASLLGCLWGLGHSTGQLILGLMMVVLKDRFNSLVPALAKWGGTSVGLSLVCIGVMGLMELRAEVQAAQHPSQPGSQEDQRSRLHSQPAYAAGGGAYGGASFAAPASSSSAVASNSAAEKDFSIGTFITGVLYGLQPDALFVIVPALTLPTKLAAAGYCLMFVLGTVGAMGGYTAVIGACSKAIKDRNPWLTTNLNALASAVAVGVGATVLAAEWGLTS